MIRKVNIKDGYHLSDYEYYNNLYVALRNFKKEVQPLLSKIKNKKIWMVSSTETGGGVAEMIPRIINIFKQLGLQAEWLVIETDNHDFFKVTKKLHNQIHGKGEGKIYKHENDIYEKVNKDNAEELSGLISENDLVVIHDPQPLALGMYIKRYKPVKVIWRCHIGLDKENDKTHTAWHFLKTYMEHIDHFVFTAPEYIPGHLSGNVSLITPAIDPLSHKNRHLPLYKITGILQDAKLSFAHAPKITPYFDPPVKRLQPDGTYDLTKYPESLGLPFRQVVTQISRWDHLKGFLPLMKAFVYLKENRNKFNYRTERHQNLTDTFRLILAGPEPGSVKDDPEGQQVIEEINEYYKSLSEDLQKDIAILMLPMQSRKINELIVNVLQRVSTFVIQNSIEEGFGLTVTEAMWKATPVMVSNACGLTQQVRDKIDGRVINEPENVMEIANTLNEMLGMEKNLDTMAFNAQSQVINKFLIFNQVSSWLNVLNKV